MARRRKDPDGFFIGMGPRQRAFLELSPKAGIKVARESIGVGDKPVLGFTIVTVPMWLMTSRRGAAVFVGSMINVPVADICGLHGRTINGEPRWVFAFRSSLRPEIFDHLVRD